MHYCDAWHPLHHHHLQGNLGDLHAVRIHVQLTLHFITFVRWLGRSQGSTPWNPLSLNNLMIDRSLTATPPTTFQPSPSFLQCHVILHALPIEPLTSPPEANFLMSPCCFPLPHPYPCSIPFTRSNDANSCHLRKLACKVANLPIDLIYKMRLKVKWQHIDKCIRNYLINWST